MPKEQGKPEYLEQDKLTLEIEELFAGLSDLPVYNVRRSAAEWQDLGDGAYRRRVLPQG